MEHEAEPLYTLICVDLDRSRGFVRVHNSLLSERDLNYEAREFLRVGRRRHAVALEGSTAGASLIDRTRSGEGRQDSDTRDPPLLRVHLTDGTYFVIPLCVRRTYIAREVIPRLRQESELLWRVQQDLLFIPARRICQSPADTPAN